MFRAVNRQRVLILTVVVLLTAAVAASYRLWRPRETELQEAEAALAARDFNRAGELLDKHLRTHPHDREALLMAARAARRRGDTAAATERVRKYERAGGSRERAELEERMIHIEEGDLTPVLGLAADAIDRRIPETPLVAEAIAEGCLKVLSPELGTTAQYGDNALVLLGATRRAADAWLELRPAPAEQIAGLVWRGRVQCLLGEHAGGLPDLRKAVELAPEQYEPRRYYAFFVAGVDTVEGIRQFSILRQQNPDDAPAVFTLARLDRAAGRYDEAQQLLDGLLAATPKDARILFERGLLAMSRSQYAEAEPYLLRADEAQPDMKEVCFALIQCMRFLGDTERMKKYRDRYARMEDRRGRAKSSDE